ncbi:MAG: cytochrome c3 family protein [Magnetococcales bacterium]|nr:cytochrome c3 family protein [Magnetococcales bacterium]
MSSYKPWLTGVALLLGLVFWMRAGGGAMGHLAQSRCQGCHVTEQVSPENARMLIASQEKLCASCHPKAIQLSHPSGFFPGRVLPATYPLDWKGELTCGSCHTIHGDTPGLMRTLAKGGVFCRECHDDAFFEQMPDRGASMVASGHLDAGGARPVVDLDPYSLQCMGCHDDKAGDAPMRVNLAGGGVMRHMGSSLSHPIGREYAKAISFGGYRPLAALPAKVALPDGRVGCVSCHEGYSQKHGGLTVDNTGSALCLACHDL